MFTGVMSEKEITKSIRPNRHDLKQSLQLSVKNNFPPYFPITVNNETRYFFIKINYVR